MDDVTLDYMRRTGRTDEEVALVEAYAKAQGLFRSDDAPVPTFTRHLRDWISAPWNLPLAGPKRPQDRIALSDMKESFNNCLTAPVGHSGFRAVQR